jgi:hypothetical protein
VLSPLVDHLWQSILCLLLAALCVLLARRNGALVRLWLWRLAALKFVVPFAVIARFGGAIGLPGRWPDEGAPPALLQAIQNSLPFTAPARAASLEGLDAVAALAVLVAMTVVCGRALWQQLLVERWYVELEDDRVNRNPDDVPPGLGLWRGALFTLVALTVLALPMLAGAAEDREWRRQLILENARSLLNASIEMRPAAPGLGERVRVIADANGVRVRNVTLQQLSGLAYGVSIYSVWASHKMYPEDRATDWFAGQRFDLHAAGRIREPDEFDAYALRVPVTRMLADKYGVEVYLNDKCQPPCGVYGVPIPEEQLP